MGEPKYPFAPVPYFPQAPTQYSQPQIQYQQPVPVQAEPVENLGVWCDACGELIEWDEQCVEVFSGKLARGKKSGQPVVVGTEVAAEMPPGIVHIWCVVDFYHHHVDDGEEETKEPVICAMCEEEIEND